MDELIQTVPHVPHSYWAFCTNDSKNDSYTRMFMFYPTCICKGARMSCIKHISPNVILSGESNSTKNLEILILFPLGYQQLCIQTTVSLNRRFNLASWQISGTQRSPQGAERIHDVFATWMLVFAIKVGTKCLNTSNHQNRGCRQILLDWI